MNNLQNITYKLIGCEVTKTISGGGNGSILVFELDNMDVAIFIYCSWRLQTKTEILTSSNESSEANIGHIPVNIGKLNGKKIVNVKYSDHCDLFFHFENGKELSIFCDITPNYPNKEYDENWSICFPKENLVYTLDNNFILQTSGYH